MVLDARWTGNLLVVLHLRPNRLAIIVSPWEFGLALTSYRTHRRKSNFPTDGANCRGTVFRLSPLQWICREWGQKLGSDEATACFGDERHTESGGPTSQKEGTPRSRTRMHQPLSITQEPPSCFWASSFRRSLLLFIPLFRSSSSYTCQSSMPIFKCTSPQPFFLALCELLWSPSPCPGVTSISKGVRVLVVYI